MERSGFWFLLAFSGSSLRYYPQNFNEIFTHYPSVLYNFSSIDRSILFYFFSFEKIATQLGDISCRKYTFPTILTDNGLRWNRETFRKTEGERLGGFTHTG